MATEAVSLRNGEEATLTTVPMLAGDAGVQRTMSDMADLVAKDYHHPNVTKVAAKLKKATKQQTVYATFKWLVDNFKYKSDGENEFLTSPWITAAKLSPFEMFDCDDMSMLLSALLAANGIQTAFKAIAWRDTNPKYQFTHVYVLAKVDNGWIPLDAVMGMDGFGKERAPVYRTLIVPVNIPNTSMLNDVVNPKDVPNEVLATEIAKRIFSGEDPGKVIEDVGRRMCIQGIQYELQQRRPMLIAGGVGIAAVFVGVGYLIGKRKGK